jgi:hypothetical protein
VVEHREKGQIWEARTERESAGKKMKEGESTGMLSVQEQEVGNVAEAIKVAWPRLAGSTFPGQFLAPFRARERSVGVN